MYLVIIIDCLKLATETDSLFLSVSPPHIRGIILGYLQANCNILFFIGEGYQLHLYKQLVIPESLDSYSLFYYINYFFMERISKQLSTMILLWVIAHYRPFSLHPLLYETYGLFLAKEIYENCNKEKYR